MIRRILVAASAAALTLGLVPGAAAVQDGTSSVVGKAGAAAAGTRPVLRLAPGDGPALYIVRLQEPAVAAYEGGVAGLAATRSRDGEKLDAQSAPAVAYADHLRAQQGEVVAAAAARIGREPTLRHRYTHALNGFATELTPDEARAVAELPDVAAVTADEMRQLTTDVGPEWIGAPTIWGQATGVHADLAGSVFESTPRERVLGSVSAGQAVGPQQTFNLDFDDAASAVPPGATAVVLNLTVSGATTNTFVSVCPGGTAAGGCDDESNVNPRPGEDVAAQVVVQLPQGAGTETNSVEIYNNLGSVNVFADLTGWFVDGDIATGGALLRPVDPTRVVDFEPVAAGELVTVDLDDSIDVPEGARAVALNVTGTGVTGTTYVSACEGGTTVEECRGTSVLNLYAAKDAANLTILSLSAENTVSFYSNAADIQIIGDAQGWFVDSVLGGSAFQATEPTRVLDRAQLAAADVTTLDLDEVVDEVPAGTTAVALNLTSTEGTEETFISACPGGTAVESCNDSSVVNPRQGEDRANMVFARLNPDENTVDIYNNAGSVKVIADLAGFFLSSPSGEIRTDGSQGEGIVAGIIDSGIVPENPSFADRVAIEDGGDGYDHSNPRGEGSYVGVCDPASGVFVEGFPCNDKLVGAWDFTGDQEEGGESPRDDDGHGTHTASTTAGNRVQVTTESLEDPPFLATEDIKGVAPHANVIAYDVCGIPTPEGELDPGCSLAAIVAAINQAILEEVDVLNYSIGGGSSDPWDDADTLGFLSARLAGIFVATSAGNSGPGAETVGSPAEAPWITSVAATTHDRQWQSSVTDITGDEGATLPDIQGLGFSSGTDGALPIVDAGAAPYDNPLCLAEEFDEGTSFEGLIVLCERGVSGRVEKGEVVAALGAAGMVLMNDEPNGSSLLADPHALPAAHISYDEGVALREFIAANEEVTASITGGTRVQADELGDVMAGFSSRGPNLQAETLVPSLSAPGVDVLAANGTGDDVQWGFISGTSMASPHVAGAGALLKAVRPGWTPAETQSALMTTAVTSVTDNDGTPADWFDMGSGRVDLTVAAQAGLLLNETTDRYLAVDPFFGGDPGTLNIAAMVESDCLVSCTWQRTVTSTQTGVGTWSAEGAAVTDGVEVSVEPSTFSFDRPEQTQTLTITADVTGSAPDAYAFGQVVLTPQDGSAAPVAHLPVAAFASSADLPEELRITTPQAAGTAETAPIRSAFDVTDLQATVAGLVQGVETTLTVPPDPTTDDPFDGVGSEATTVEVPTGATRVVAALSESTAPDFDLYVGIGDTPSAETLVCASGTGGSAEVCDFAPDPADAGTYWVLVQNWESSDALTDTVTLTTAVAVEDEGNLTVGVPSPEEPIEAGTPFTVPVSWSGITAEGRWYGTVTLGTSVATPDDIGTFLVTLTREVPD